MGWLQTEGRGKLSGIGSSFIEGCPCFPTVIARYGARDRPLFQPGPILLLRSSLVRGLGSNIMLRGTMGCNVGTSYSEIQVLYSGLGNPLSVRGRAGTIPCRVYAVSMQSTRLGNPTPKLRCGEPCPYLDIALSCGSLPPELWQVIRAVTELSSCQKLIPVLRRAVMVGVRVPHIYSKSPIHIYVI